MHDSRKAPVFDFAQTDRFGWSQVGKVEASLADRARTVSVLA